MLRRIWIGLVTGLLAAQAMAGSVTADQGRWTKGDAEAMLNTYPLTGQIFVRLDEALGLDIRPFPELYEATPYCVADWHVLALAWFDWAFEVVGGPNDGLVVTRDDVQDSLRDLGWQFSLDGATIGTIAPLLRPLVPDEGTRAEIESLLEEDLGGDVILGQGFGLQPGRIMAPYELAVGQHTLRVIVTSEGSELFDQAVTFTIHPTDSAACNTPVA
jgi:hypothetical protein